MNIKITNLLLFIQACIRVKELSLKSGLRVVLQLIRKKKEIRFQWGGKDVWIINDSPKAVLYNISDSLPKMKNLVDKIENCSVAIDVGANNGFFSVLLLRKFGSCCIHVYEPSPKLQKVLKLNLGKFENVIVHPQAVSRIEGQVTFHVNNLSQQTNSIDLEKMSQGSHSDLLSDTEAIQIDSVILSNEMKKNNLNSVDVLKIDIQGNEFDVLNDPGLNFDKVSAIIIEMSFLDEKVFQNDHILSKHYSWKEVVNPVKYGADLMYRK